MNYRFIITGSPGSGKTSIIDLLAEKGYSVFEENSRQIIELKGVIPPIHNENRDNNFFEEILRLRIHQYSLAEIDKLSFYDRGIPDSMAYFLFMGLRLPSKLHEAIANHPYNPNVFILPPWQEIFHGDQARKESFDESVRLYGFLRESYTALGYTLVEVPKIPVDKRVKFILNHTGLQ